MGMGGSALHKSVNTLCQQGLGVKTYKSAES